MRLKLLFSDSGGNILGNFNHRVLGRQSFLKLKVTAVLTKVMKAALVTKVTQITRVTIFVGKVTKGTPNYKSKTTKGSHFFLEAV